jgi:hypothetical protein
MWQAIFYVLCLAGGLCSVPVRVDIYRREARIRYLWFRWNLGSPKPLARRFLGGRGIAGALEIWGSFFRRPLRLKRFRINASFSAGGAAETALLYGGLCCLAGCLPARSGAEITLEPRFSSREEFSLDWDISFSMPAAVFLCRMIAISARRASWRNIRGKEGLCV